MALAKPRQTTAEKLVENAETLVRGLRRATINSYNKTGQMPTAFIDRRIKIQLEHDASALKVNNAALYTRVRGATKANCASMIAAASAGLVDPSNLELLWREVSDPEIGWCKAALNFLRRVGIQCVINGGISTLITEIIEESYKAIPTFGTNFQLNIYNASIGAAFGAFATVAIQAILLIYHHLEENRLNKKMTEASEFKEEIQAKIYAHQQARNYILGWRNIIKQLCTLILGAVASVFICGFWPTLILAITVPWVIWMAEKLYDHFTGARPIGFLSSIWNWMWGSTVIERSNESWVEVTADGSPIDIPNVFQCSITLCMMVHPVINNCGMIYEREALEAALAANGNRDPLTQGLVALDSIRPLPELENFIHQYAKAIGIELKRDKNSIVL